MSVDQDQEKQSFRQRNIEDKKEIVLEIDIRENNQVKDTQIQLTRSEENIQLRLKIQLLQEENRKTELSQNKEDQELQRLRNKEDFEMERLRNKDALEMQRSAYDMQRLAQNNDAQNIQRYKTIQAEHNRKTAELNIPKEKNPLKTQLSQLRFSFSQAYSQIQQSFGQSMYIFVTREPEYYWTLQFNLTNQGLIQVQLSENKIHYKQSEKKMIDDDYIYIPVKGYKLIFNGMPQWFQSP